MKIRFETNLLVPF
uniref:Uncharacterized protein n=1 Tax=Arundo donax TaxID=35708 RepID=A0A0A8ZZJ7_ARUDO